MNKGIKCSIIVLFACLILLFGLSTTNYADPVVTPTATLSLSNANYTNQDITATITVDALINTPSGWTKVSDYVFSKVYTQNTTETVYLENKNTGVTGSIEIQITRIFKNCTSLKSLSYSTKEPTNQNVTVTVEFQFTDGAPKYMSGTDGWTDRNMDGTVQSKEFEQNIDQVFLFHDIEGNEIPARVTITNIDKEPPVLSESKSTTSMTNQNVTVTLNANKIIQAPSGWNLSSDKMSITKAYIQNTTENVTVLDALGNSTKKEIIIDNIDKTSPSFGVYYSNKDYTNQDVTVVITANEEIESIDGWTLSSDQLSLTKVYHSNATENVNVTDLVGNINPYTVKIENIDKTDIVPEVTYSTKQATNQPVTVKIKINKKLAESIYSDWTYSSDGMSIEKTYSNNIETTIKLIDVYGNMKDTDIKIENIDLKGPIITAVRAQNIANTVSLTLSAMDDTSTQMAGLNTDSMKYYISDNPNMVENFNNAFVNGQTISKTLGSNETYYVWLRASDNFGNVTNKRYDMNLGNINGYDTVVQYSVVNSTEGNVTAIIISRYELEPLDGWILGSDKYSLSKTFDKNINQNYEITDERGIKKSVNVNIQNIVETSFKKGDVNENGMIDIGDIVKIQRHIAASNSSTVLAKHADWILSEKKFLIADVNGNSQIDINDIVKIQRYIAASNSSVVASKHPDWLIL